MFSNIFLKMSTFNRTIDFLDTFKVDAFNKYEIYPLGSKLGI